jgi:hypothetical protein
MAKLSRPLRKTSEIFKHTLDVIIAAVELYFFFAPEFTAQTYGAAGIKHSAGVRDMGVKVGTRDLDIKCSLSSFPKIAVGGRQKWPHPQLPAFG